jgi:hypothetical protein
MLTLLNVISICGTALLKSLYPHIKHGSECFLRKILIKPAMFDFSSSSIVNCCSEDSFQASKQKEVTQAKFGL